ncbi:MAG TPA: alginate lyase family protein [Candidatus Brocadiia bacterium]|nr:alginate lyase family protein [Candidatus Brocadiia bacterium]
MDMKEAASANSRIMTLLVAMAAAVFLISRVCRMDACMGAPGPAQRATPPKVFILNPDQLVLAREMARKGDKAILPAFKQLVSHAQSVMDKGPFTVTKKPFDPPSKDRHDYMSLSIYWWPNPVTKIPYIRRDGEVNPEVEKFDGPKLLAMASTVEALSQAYFFTGDERYAYRATILLRAWFLDEKTRMNPNMNFAQGIPGICEGNRSGIIESVTLATQVVDSVGLIQTSKSWKRKDHEELQKWFGEYMNWLQSNPMAKSECEAENNHGVWYDAQVCAYAMFIDKPEMAKAVIEKRSGNRIIRQVKPDGSQPEELARTKSFSYSIYNLDAMFTIAAVGDKVGADLWNYKSEDGRGMRKALDYLTPYVNPQKKWTMKQIVPFDNACLYPFLRKAAIAYKDPSYERMAQQLEAQSKGALDAHRVNLLYPRAQGGK